MCDDKNEVPTDLNDKKYIHSNQFYLFSICQITHRGTGQRVYDQETRSKSYQDARMRATLMKSTK